MQMPLSHDMVQCGFAVVGFPNIDSMPPGPDYNSSSTTGEDGEAVLIMIQIIKKIIDLFHNFAIFF